MNPKSHWLHCRWGVAVPCQVSQVLGSRGEAASVLRALLGDDSGFACLPRITAVSLAYSPRFLPSCPSRNQLDCLFSWKAPWDGGLQSVTKRGTSWQGSCCLSWCMKRLLKTLGSSAAIPGPFKTKQHAVIAVLAALVWSKHHGPCFVTCLLCHPTALGTPCCWALPVASFHLKGCLCFLLQFILPLLQPQNHRPCPFPMAGSHKPVLSPRADGCFHQGVFSATFCWQVSWGRENKTPRSRAVVVTHQWMFIYILHQPSFNWDHAAPLGILHRFSSESFLAKRLTQTNAFQLNMGSEFEAIPAQADFMCVI